MAGDADALRVARMGGQNPIDLSKAAEPAAREAFEALPSARCSAHARQLAEARNPKTRDRRINKILESLRG